MLAHGFYKSAKAGIIKRSFSFEKDRKIFSLAIMASSGGKACTGARKLMKPCLQRMGTRQHHANGNIRAEDLMRVVKLVLF